ncbi:MAG: trypsin-like peptidase domain-containing protein [Patescibacteria group bacterium]
MDLNSKAPSAPWKSFRSNYKARCWKFAGVALAIIAIAFAGSLWTLYMLSGTAGGAKLRDKLGINDVNGINVQSTRTNKIIIEESSAIIDASKKVGQAVVSITSTSNTTRNVFGLGQIRAPETSGTGFIITSDGLIATNKHVISSGDTFTVTTAEGKSFDGKLVAKDPTNDLALLKIEARGLPVVEIGDSDKVEVGQWVIAIGNALGELQNSVTVGVVSAKERVAQPSDGAGNVENLAGLFQTDAAINPGNSGGPLLTLAGQVIGINTAVAGNAQNIGFAIPVMDLKKDLESYSKNGKIIQPYIGVGHQPITKVIAKNYSLPVEQGAWLVTGDGSSAIVANSPAATAGLKDNDIITKINNDKVTETTPLARLVRKYSPGEIVTLTVLRDKNEITVKLTLGQLGQ